MKVKFIGDTHQYGQFVTIGTEPTIHVGDLFLGIGYQWHPSRWEPNFGFIGGNHDDPALCRVHPNYLGDFGYKEDLKLFFVSGASSVSWDKLPHFEEEERTEEQLQAAYDLYCQIKPKYMVSHDCPASICRRFFGFDDYSRTRDYLEQMLKAHRPDMWVFGHYHTSVDVKVDGCRWVGLGMVERKYLDLDI